jgi:hypothetical protein
MVFVAIAFITYLIIRNANDDLELVEEDEIDMSNKLIQKRNELEMINNDAHNESDHVEDEDISEVLNAVEALTDAASIVQEINEEAEDESDLSSY